MATRLPIDPGGPGHGQDRVPRHHDQQDQVPRVGGVDRARTHTLGYRKFYAKDLERLRAILKMQQDEYLPLKVIEERLLDQEASTTDASTPIADEAPEPADELAEPPTGLQMSLDEMSAATGIDRERIRELEVVGLVSSHGPSPPGTTTGTTTSCCRSSRLLPSASNHGTSPCTGTSPSEGVLLQSIVMPQLRQRNPDARRTAMGSLTELARASRKLKSALLRTNLRQYLS